MARGRGGGEGWRSKGRYRKNTTSDMQFDRICGNYDHCQSSIVEIVYTPKNLSMSPGMLYADAVWHVPEIEFQLVEKIWQFVEDHSQDNKSETMQIEV